MSLLETLDSRKREKVRALLAGRPFTLGKADESIMKRMAWRAAALERMGWRIDAWHDRGAALALAMAATPALAQSATKIGSHDAWGTYSYQAQNGKVCYVLTVPRDKQPPSLDHGDIFFFVSQRPASRSPTSPSSSRDTT
jgi:hypothetical protein